MSRISLPRRLAYAGLAALIAAPLPAQETAKAPVTWGDLVAIDRVFPLVGQFGVTLARSFVKLTYDDMRIDLQSGTVTLIAPRVGLGDLGPQPGCEIAAARLRLSGVPIEVTDRARMSLELENVAASPACLPPDAGFFIAATGKEQIEADMLRLDIDYDYPSGAMDAMLELDLADLAAVTLEAKADYVGMLAGDWGPEPLIELREAELLIEDDGVWDLAEKMLPPGALAQEALRETVTDALIQAVREAMGPGELSMPANMVHLINEAAEAVAGLPEGPRELALRLNGPLVINEEFTFQSERDVLAALDLEVRRGALAPERVLPVQMLQQALADPAQLSASARRELGLALLSGEGVPRYPAFGIELLAPMVDADDGGEIAGALAGALAGQDPVQAYGYGLIAAARGASGAVALLDRIEAEQGMGWALEMQEGRGSDQPDPASITRRAELRHAARAAYLGRDVSRSYGWALYWARLGAAAGDAASASLAQEIEDRLRRSDLEAGKLTAFLNDLQQQAMETWISLDMPAQLAGE